MLLRSWWIIAANSSNVFFSFCRSKPRFSCTSDISGMSTESPFVPLATIVSPHMFRLQPELDQAADCLAAGGRAQTIFPQVGNCQISKSGASDPGKNVLRNATGQPRDTAGDRKKYRRNPHLRSRTIVCNDHHQNNNCCDLAKGSNR